MLLSILVGFMVRRLDAIYVRLCNRRLAVSEPGVLLSIGTVYVAMPPSDGIQPANRMRFPSSVPGSCGWAGLWVRAVSMTEGLVLGRGFCRVAVVIDG
jgi:hypothetical protein